MNLENQTKESPLEKAKRLKAEKESKDQVKMEAEAKKQADAQAKTEKMNILNSQKQELENQLNEIDVKIETSRSEARETRDTMKEGGLDKDEEFKDEYQATVSEVAGNLNELRNERNLIKSKLEKINSDIENFDINEAINEGKEAMQKTVENVNGENEEAVAQVESYPGADAQDVEKAKEVVDETSKEINQVVENVEKNIKKREGNFVHGLENSNKTLQIFEQSLSKFANIIREVEAMKKGSLEKYEAAIQMSHQSDDELFLPYSGLKTIIENSEDGNEQEIQATKLRLENCLAEWNKIEKEMMITWWNAKGQYEGGKSSEIAKYYTEIEQSNITLARAEQLLSSEGLDDSGKEYIATRLMNKFMNEGRDDEVFRITTLAREKGFYTKMGTENLNADFVRSIKHKNPNLYEKAKALLGPNTKPYV